MSTPLVFQEPTTPPTDPAEPFDPTAPTAEAPYGYTVDPDTGARRPKKTRGRVRKTTAAKLPTDRSPSLDELKAAGGREKREDVAPGTGSTTPTTGPKVVFGKGPKQAPAPDPLPPFRAGPIAKSVNRIYRRAGKILKIWDPMLGAAVIRTTVKTIEYDEDGLPEESLTVGEAWEKLAQTNPRIRRLLLKLIETSAVGELIAAHLPIILAIMMKEAVLKRIPFGRLIAALLTDEDDQGEEMPSGLADMMGGIGPADAAAMMAMVQGMMGGMVADMPRGMNDVRPAEAPGEAA